MEIGFAMDATIDISPPWAGRQSTDVAARCGVAFMSSFSRRFGSGSAEIFKKTPTIAGLKPRGREVAPDLREFAAISLLMKTFLRDRAISAGDDVAVRGRGFAIKSRALNAKLTDKKSLPHKSERKLRATNHTSGAMWVDAPSVGSVANGTVAGAGTVHEKYCDADI